ncbi:Cof-type HAD-IIB family hydrolase [Fluviispira multicolorata]|uniref:Cof-type HAD-IIB family hydrolase n=1 Tax=Fluviispira multicolorata TaxID=2654512 RepID=A0A833JD80_9BACT|nr:Cof-type HAD-IIB family hydrolase [Fluviispira multicolorata]KAB8030780.1 Cof-type HAD-IIB family hydrolase [Fluviispira multicolorata]
MKAVALDLDGTLLNSKHCVSPLAKKTLNELVKSGIKIVLASARPIQSVLQIAQNIGLENEMMIGGNGSIIAKNADEILYTNSILKSDLINIFTSFKYFCEQNLKNELTMHIYSQFNWLVPYNTLKAQEEARIIGFSPNIIGDQSYQIDTAEKIMVVAHPDLLNNFSQFLKEKIKHLGVVLSKPDSLEINAQGVSKFSGVEEYAKLVSLGMSDFICMGDGDNDEKMLKNCGLGVAMANASLAARNAAKEIALSNDQDGVALFLRKYFSL